MIVLTGAAGFIGSCMASYLNKRAHTDLVLVDDFGVVAKKKNWQTKRYLNRIHRNRFFHWFNKNHKHISFVIHLGARTDTTLQDKSVFDNLNVAYSKSLWELCTQHQIPMLYASSAATYGAGKQGYSDNHEVVPRLQPLNPYGVSKNEFDKWVLTQKQTPPSWWGIKFFNVYGPNEYHKGRMASVIFHAFQQIRATTKVKLFRSHRPDYADGQQLRDFVYVKDVVRILYFFMKNKPSSGLYNLGTGKAQTFEHLAKGVFKALAQKTNIEFIDMPIDIRENYQYFTQANLQKLRKVGYRHSLMSLEDGIQDYVQNYLIRNKFF